MMVKLLQVIRAALALWFFVRFSSLQSLDLAKSHVKIVSLFEMIAPSPPMKEESPNL